VALMKYGGLKSILLDMDGYSDDEGFELDKGSVHGAADHGADRKVTRVRRDPKSPAETNKILCRICGDGAVRHIHYGGQCCFSCKAFFRRAVNWQNKNTREFQCKFDGNCDITIKNRKTCQCCRFQKCVTTGMNPSWVLSDQQRKKRFKKYRETDDLSPTSSQDSSRDCDAEIPVAPEPSNRRRAKSAPAIRLNQAKLYGREPTLPSSQPVSPLDRHLGEGLNRFNAPDVSSIKLEPEFCGLSPLRGDESFCYAGFNLDQASTPIKEEVNEDDNIDLELDQIDKLHSLISSCDFTRDFSDDLRMKQPPPPDELQHRGGASSLLPIHRGDASSLHPNPRGGASSLLPFHRGGALPHIELSERETMSLIKLEMSFENSNSSFPQMMPETSNIWSAVMHSCDLASLKNHLTSSLLSEAVELCLRRNLMFLQENPDFTSLSLDTRTRLYIANMGSMCHVRGVMQRGTSAAASSSNFTCVSGDNNLLQISYKNQATGQIRRWNLLKDESRATTNDASSLLQLAESIWRLQLGRSVYLLLLLLVLFSSQGCSLQEQATVDRFQNKYLALLYRHLQAEYGETDAKQHIQTIMKFVLALLTTSY